MTERVIITLRSDATNNESDFEAPADMQIGDLKNVLGAKLFSLSGEVSHDTAFYLNGKRLNERDTLASYGLWSGSIVVFK